MEKALTTHPKENFIRPDTIQNRNPVLLGQVPPEDPPHSILHYINKNNPTGPAPQNPAADPMYLFWETAIQNYITPQPVVPPTETQPITPLLPPTTTP